LGAILAHGGAPAGQNAPMPPPRLAARSARVLAVLLAAPLPAVADADSVERGRALLAQYQCGSCHTIPGVEDSHGRVAQPLSGWRHRSYIAGRLPNRPDVLARWIAAPQALVPGTAMPSMGVSPEDARAMAAYLFSLR
jgi:cytochrome c